MKRDISSTSHLIVQPGAWIKNELIALTLDAVPERWDRLDVLEKGDREPVNLALILHNKERVVGFKTNKRSGFSMDYGSCNDGGRSRSAYRYHKRT
jgi:hypothetical protein